MAVLLRPMYTNVRNFTLYDKNNYTMFSEDVVNYYYNMFHESCDIYINECQFFPDLKVFVLDMMSLNKNVYIYGLDGDFKQDIIGQTLELIPYCSRIEKKNWNMNCVKRNQS